MVPNGTRLFIAEKPLEDPGAVDIYLGSDEAGAGLPDDVTVVQGWTATPWLGGGSARP